MTIKHNRILPVVKVHGHAKYRQAKSSSLCVIVATEKQTKKQILPLWWKQYCCHYRKQQKIKL